MSTTKPSTRQKSLLLAEKLNTLLDGRDPSTVPFRRRRVIRQWVANQIGCSSVTLTTSRRLRSKLTAWEKENAPASPTSSDANTMNESLVVAIVDNVIPITPPSLGELILPIDINILGKIYTVPVLYDGDRVDEWVSRYLRFLLIKSKHAYSSVHETAKKLRIFRRFQRACKLSYADVTDDVLVSWQHSMEKAGKSINRRNDCITTVHGFFEWAETQGLLTNHVQFRAMSDYQFLPDGYVFPISSEEVLVKRQGRTYTTWVSTLIEPGGKSSFGNRHTPTAEEVERLILEVASHERNAIRNSLIVSWALRTGGRISELLQVRVSDLPSEDTIGELVESDDQQIAITVNRKNLGKGSLIVPLDVILGTLHYIWSDKDRAQIVEKYPRKDNDFLFLSEKGGVLSTDSVTRICAGFFAKAKIDNANIHRLRARYITEIIEGVLDDLATNGQSIDLTTDWAETVLIDARNRMGHSHVMSLRPYLNEIRIRRVLSDGRIKPRDPETGKTELSVINRELFERMKLNREFAEVEKVSGTNKKAAADMLRRLADQMEKQAA
jgi:integrase